MKTYRTFVNIVAVLVACHLAATAAQASTILTFDKDPQFSASFGQNKLYGTADATHFPDYGDNVTGPSQSAPASGRPATNFLYGMVGNPTPTIVADYFVGDDPTLSGIGEGAHVLLDPSATPGGGLFPFSVDLTLNRIITLTAAPTTDVILEAFTLLTFGSPRNIHNMQVVFTDSLSQQTTWSSGFISIPASGKTFTIADFGFKPSQSVSIDFTPGVDGHNNYLFDNIQFTIPEPASMSLLMVGSLTLLSRRGHRVTIA